MTPIVLEVCVDSLHSAEEAVRGGANRLEVCGSLAVGGGATPSLGLVRAISKRYPHIPLMVMVRPRIGDFVYAQSEIEVMLEDIGAFKIEEVAGIVLGVLTCDGDVDVAKTIELVDAARPLEVTFHRAFDMTSDPFKACETIALINGITRILTSGHAAPKVPSALPTFAQLQRHLDHCMKNRVLLHPETHIGVATLKLMPGSGINTDTIAQVVQALHPIGINEYHLSAGVFDDSEVSSNSGEGKLEYGMGDWKVWRTKADIVRDVRLHAEDTVDQLRIS
ncbi:hypothetical protein FRB95_002667 [Tulasnella sp. JGI-2019a]|nr:hypothetical protein FRB95_002667 [Tulasnella sp. JGI-2019a]